MPEYFAFDCGCKFPILDNNGEYPKIDFSPKPESVNFDCSRTRSEEHTSETPVTQ